MRVHTSFHPFTEIGQIFHDKYVFNNNRTFQVEIWKMVWTNVLFFQFLSIRCSLNNSETRERELIPNKIPGVTFPRPPLQACFLQQQQQVYFKLNIVYKACARN